MSASGISTKRLRPCLCGGEALLYKYQTGTNTTWDGKERAVSTHYVECPECGHHTKEYRSKSKAIDVWNRMVKR